MGSRAVPWLAAAIVQAGVIVWLALQLAGPEAPPLVAPRPDAVAADTATVAPPSRTEASSPAGVRAPTDAAAAPTPSSPRAAEAAGAPAAALGTLLHGTVRARNDAPLERVNVNLFRGAEPKSFADTSAGAGGALRAGQLEFAIPGLDAGEYRLTASGQNMRKFEHTFAVPPATPDVRLDVVLDASWLIKVALLTPDGRPLRETLKDDKDLQMVSPFELVSVVAWGTELPEQLPPTDGRTTTFTIATWQASDGFERPRGGGRELPAKYAGVLEMREERAAVVAATFADTVLAQVPVQSKQEEVSLAVDPRRLRAMLGTVRLQVVDAATNAPVPDAKVALNSSGWRQPTPVGAEGRFEQGKLRPDVYTVVIDAGGRIGPSLSVRVAPGAVLDLGAVPVMAPFPLSLKVEGPGSDGQLAVTLRALEPHPAATASTTTQRLGGSKGQFLAKVWPGRYHVRLLAGNHGAMLELDTRELGAEPVVVALQPEPVLQVDPGGDEPAQLVLRTERGTIVHDRWITWKTVFQVRLPAGTYRATVRRLAGTAREDTIRLPPEGTKYVLR